MKQLRFLILFLGLALTMTSWVLAQDGNLFMLQAGGSHGGGGQSSNGRFTVYGSVEPQDNTALSGGDFQVTGGNWSAVCLKPSEVAEVAIALHNAQIELRWTSSAVQFAIYRANNDPYFMPSSVYDTDEQAPWLDSDTSGIGDTANNYTYLILASNVCGQSGFSQRVGEFDFAIQAGN